MLNKTLFISFIVLISFGVGMIAGTELFRHNNITKTYEDGSFYGCLKGGLCND